MSRQNPNVQKSCLLLAHLIGLHTERNRNDKVEKMSQYSPLRDTSFLI
jgi:hypothetical protein